MLWTKKHIKETEATTKNTGDRWESYACNYLVKHGLVLLNKNFHSRQGEVDLVMRDKNTIVFIEVKYRKTANFGGAIAAISYKKQQKIIKTAAFYLQQHGLKEYNTACRFDVIAIEGPQNQNEITWLKNAFE